MFPLVATAFLFKYLEAADFLCRHIAPRNREVRRIEFQFQQALEQAPSARIRPRIIEIVQTAVRAAIDREQPCATLAAGARSVSVIHPSHEAAFAAGNIVRIRTSARTFRTALTEIAHVD